MSSWQLSYLMIEWWRDETRGLPDRASYEEPRLQRISESVLLSQLPTRMKLQQTPKTHHRYICLIISHTSKFHNKIRPNFITKYYQISHFLVILMNETEPKNLIVHTAFSFEVLQTATFTPFPRAWSTNLSVFWVQYTNLEKDSN